MVAPATKGDDLAICEDKKASDISASLPQIHYAQIVMIFTARDKLPAEGFAITDDDEEVTSVLISREAYQRLVSAALRADQDTQTSKRQEVSSDEGSEQVYSAEEVLAIL
ncbi:MAG: hypothetical protein AAF936_14145 [Pseudomonadota bacterium]